MIANFRQSVSCSNGHGYIINYDLVDIKNLTNDPTILKELDGVFVYDIALKIVEDNNTKYLKKSINFYSDLNTIASYIHDFLESNKNVILYFFCDNKAVYYNDKNKSVSCQEFRSALFSSMFQRFCKTNNSNNYYNFVIEIKGIDETYYTHLIYDEIHSEKTNKISELLSSMNK